MNITTLITYDSVNKLYKIENENKPVWMPAWDNANGTNITDFGLNINGLVMDIASNFDIISIKPLNYNFQYDMLIIGKTATFSDVTNTSFNGVVKFTFEIIYEIDQFECKDIDGEYVNNFIFADDGVIYGTGDDLVREPSSINAQCCSALGYIFDPNLVKCFWSKPCEIDDVIKIIINSEGDSGIIFQVDEPQICTLDIEFDYLLEYDCENLLSCSLNESLLDILSGVTVSMSLERLIPNYLPKTIFNQEFEANLINQSVYESILFDGSQIVNYISSENSGIFINGSNCQLVIDIVKGQLGDSASGFTETSLFSNWLHFKVSIVDESLLTQIRNEKINLALKVKNSSCDMSILIDNIQLNKNCQLTDIETTFIGECPSFEIERVIDNKKSWVAKEEFEERIFDLSRRETDYFINHNKLGINSKEMDLNVSPSRAIETDIMQSTLSNPCLLGTGVELNLTDVFTLEDFNEILTTQLIDAKSRQTIRDYPLLRAVFDRYLNSMEYCGITTNSFNYDNMDDFILLIGNYWVDLVEQLIPSTTIWGSTYKYNNTIFDNNKFKYRKGSLFTCEIPQGYSPIGSENDIEVISVEVNNDEFTKNLPNKCKGVYMVQINDGSEFIGSVTILGKNGLTNDTTNGKGDIIILNELFDSLGDN